MLFAMKKPAWAGVGAVVTLVSLFGGRTVWEYSQVAHANLKSAVQDAVPIGVDIQRLELVAGKLEQSIAGDRREVAKAAVSLERAEQEMAAEQAHMQKSLQKMAELRRLLDGQACQVRVGCSVYQRTEVEQALRHKLDEYKAAEQAVQQRTVAVQKHRDAFRQLSGRMAERQHERTLLQQKVATLRAQHQAVQMTKGESLGSFDESTLAHAREIAQRIEERMRVEEKLNRLDVASLDDLPPAEPNRDVAKEFDELVRGREQSPAAAEGGDKSL